MSDCVWSFDLAHLEHSGGMPEYLLLHDSLCGVASADLPGYTLWLVAVEGPLRYLFGRAVIEGVAVADFPPSTLLFYLDRLRSCRFLPALPAERSPWQLNGEMPDEAGLKICPAEWSATFASLPTRNKISRFNPLAADGKGKPSGSSVAALRRRYAWLLRHRAFGDLHGDNRRRDLSPFSTALWVAGDDSSTAVEELVRLDTALMAERSQKAPESETKSTGSGSSAVDLLLSQFDPATASPRLFLGGSSYGVGRDTLVKTQRAESAHQAILRDLAGFLTECGCIPLQSRSVDLALDLRNGHLFFEVKSAEDGNAVEQAEAGFVQVLRYRMAARAEDLIVAASIVVIGHVPSPAVKNYLVLLGKEADVHFCFYDRTTDWPARVSGLTGLIDHHNSPYPGRPT